MLDFVQTAMQTSQDVVAGEKRQVKRRKMTDMRESVNGVAPERRSTRSHTKRIASQTSASQQSPVSTQNEIADSDEGSVYEDEQSTSRHFDGPSELEPNDGLVACPSCTKRMKESLINSHLDKCLAGEAPSPTQPTNAKPASQSPRPPHIVSGTIAYTQTKPSTSNRLPTLNYSLFNDSAMRKKLKELGIPNSGSKELMRKRHMEWLNLWNANCDSLNPVSKLQLLKDLNTWERTLGKQVEKSQQGPNGVMVKDFDRDRYAKKQKSDFDDLIARARQNRVAKKTEDPSEQSHDHQEGGPSAPIQLDGPVEHQDDQLSSREPPSTSALSGEDNVTSAQHSDSPAPAVVGSESISMPTFGWTPRTIGEPYASDSTHQPPPSSQRSMSHDITA